MRRNRIGHLVAISALGPRDLGIDAVMGVRIDQAGIDVAAGGIYDARSPWYVQAMAHSHEPATVYQDGAPLDDPEGDGEKPSVGDG